MLRELKIENLALIESLELSFDGPEEGGLVVMTGETGAGKSIMLRAIQLLTGRRASADWIRNDSGSCVVEALFEIRPEHGTLLGVLSEGGFGEEQELVIKRIITAKGRSRLYVNGSLATARVVSEITGNLINIASQHDQQQFLQPALHLDILDTLGEHWADRQTLAQMFALWQRKKSELDQLQKQEQDKEQRRDFLQFQVKEIAEAELYIGEDEELSQEKKRLKAADSLIKISQESYQLLSTSVLDSLSQIRRDIEQVALLDNQAEALAEQISGYAYQAEDMAALLREYRDSLTHDPMRLDMVNERLDLIQSLKRKYGSDIEVVLNFLEEAEKELQGLDNLEVELQELSQEVMNLERELEAFAAELSRKRRETAAFFEESVSSELLSLAFTQPLFEVRWQEVEHVAEMLLPTGYDRLEFFFTANPGEPVKPLAKVASGGELSRLMLAFKCILARKDMVDTVIFDEVDAGIGGEAAEAVARKIQELSGHHQVFCITHLPQIASRGIDHFLVEKNVKNGRTQSIVSQLSEEQRIDELARMLAGASASEQTQAWARELLTKGGAQA